MRRLDPQMQTVLVFLLSRRQLVGGGNRTPGETPVRIPIGADVPSTVASRRRALQYRLVHRQDCHTDRTSTSEYNNMEEGRVSRREIIQMRKTERGREADFRPHTGFDVIILKVLSRGDQVAAGIAI